MSMGRLNLRQLKWIAIVAPVAFLVAFDYVRHFVSAGAFLHTPAGFALIYSTVLAGVFFFAEIVFRIIGRMQEKVAQQNKDLSAVSQIAESLSLSVDIEQILQDSLKQVMGLVQADAGAICLLDAEKEELYSTTYTGFSPAMLERIRRQKLEAARMGAQVVKTGLPVVVLRAQEHSDPEIAEIARREGFVSMLSYPLTSQGKVVGVLALASKREGTFQESSLRLVSGIANQVAMAVDRASLFQEASRRAQDLAALNEVSTMVSSRLELREVLQASLSKVVEIEGMDAGEVWLWEEPGQEMVMATHYGLFQEAFREIGRFRKGEGFPGRVALTGEPLISADIAHDERFMRDAVRRAGIHFFACIPLKAEGKVVGVLELAAKESRQLLPRDLQLLTSISNQIGLAIDSARLYEQLQDLAVMEERGRIAREIHDGIGQVLGYVNIKTLAVKKLLDTGEVDVAREELSELQNAARDVYADLREAILGLRSALYRRDGFITVVEEYLDNFNQMFRIPVALSVTPEESPVLVNPQAEIQLIRVIQEALSNVRKHSNASQVQVRLEATDNETRVAIRDNGRGFDPSQLSPGAWPRFGLQTMRERAEGIGGRLEIKSSPGSGTEVLVIIPNYVQARRR